jgi:hypothetical protein
MKKMLLAVLSAAAVMTFSNSASALIAQCFPSIEYPTKICCMDMANYDATQICTQRGINSNPRKVQACQDCAYAEGQDCTLNGTPFNTYDSSHCFKR